MKNIRLILVLMLSPALQHAHAQDSLTLQRALELGMQRSDIRAIESNQIRMADADIQHAKTWDRPELSFSREQLDDPVSSSEETWVLSQTFAVSGARGHHIRAAKTRALAVSHRIAGDQRDLAHQIKRLYFQLMAYREQTVVCEAWHRQLASISAIIENRQRAGQSSGFDMRRSMLEERSARSLCDELSATRIATWHQLAALIGVASDVVPDLDASFPTWQTKSEETFRANHPRLDELAARVDMNHQQVKAHQRDVIPDVTLGLGSKRTRTESVSDSGLFLSAAIALPVFGRHRNKVAQSRAQRDLLSHQLILEKERMIGLAQGLILKANQLSESLERRTQAVAQAQQLSEIAELGYQAGEMSIIALLDTYRVLKESRIQQIDLQLNLADVAADLEQLGEVTHD